MGAGNLWSKKMEGRLMEGEKKNLHTKNGKWDEVKRKDGKKKTGQG